MHQQDKLEFHIKRQIEELDFGISLLLPGILIDILDIKIDKIT